MPEGKKINELEAISSITNETVFPAVYVNNGAANSTANKVTLQQVKTYVEQDSYTKNQVDSLLGTKQNTLTAGSNISINGTTISATDTTYSVMTGADGTSAGTSGLVPAPAATDNTKFLSGDGTWKEVQGGGSTYTAGANIDITNDVISAPNVYTKSNLVGGTNISIDAVINPDVLDENTIGCWHFNGDATNVITDGPTINSSVDITYQDATINPWYTGYKCANIGPNTYSLLTNGISEIGTNGDFTLEARLYGNVNDFGTAAIYYSNAESNGSILYYRLEIEPIQSRLSVYSGTYAPWEESSLNLGGWHHYAIVRKNGVISIYLDGIRKYQFENNANINNIGLYTQQSSDNGNRAAELVLSKIAKWDGASFTVPSQPYTISGGAVYQVNCTFSGSAPTINWYEGNTGSSVTIADTTNANLVKVYKNGLLLQPGSAIHTYNFTGGSGAYVSLANTYQLSSAASWYYEGRFKLPASRSDIGEQGVFFGFSGTSDCQGPTLGYDVNSDELRVLLSSTGSSWDIGVISTGASFTNWGTECDLKFGYENGSYYIATKLASSDTYSNIWTYSSSSKAFVGSPLQILNTANGSFGTHWNGSKVFMQYFKVVVDGDIKFNGSTAVLSTDYTNTNCTSEEVTTVSNDYTVSGTTLTLVDSLISTDKIAVEMF